MQKVKFTLKQARTYRGLTQEEMAKNLQVHVQTYRTLESNTGRITIDQAKLICRVLQMQADDIFFDTYST